MRLNNEFRVARVQWNKLISCYCWYNIYGLSMHRNLAAAVVILLSVLFLFRFISILFILPFIQLWKIFKNRQNHEQRVSWLWCEAHSLKLLVCVCVRVSHIYFSENNFMLHDIRVVRFPSSHNFYLFLNDSAAAAATTPVAIAAAVGLSFKIFMVMR